MTIVSGKALEMKSETPAADLVAKVVALLRKMFPEEVGTRAIFFFPVFLRSLLLSCSSVFFAFD